MDSSEYMENRDTVIEMHEVTEGFQRKWRLQICGTTEHIFRYERRTSGVLKSGNSQIDFILESQKIKTEIHKSGELTRKIKFG